MAGNGGWRTVAMGITPAKGKDQVEGDGDWSRVLLFEAGKRVPGVVIAMAVDGVSSAICRSEAV